MIAMTCNLPQGLAADETFKFDSHCKTRFTESHIAPSSSSPDLFQQRIRIDVVLALIDGFHNLPCEGVVVTSIRDGKVAIQGRLNFWDEQAMAIGQQHANELTTYCEEFSKRFPTTSLRQEVVFDCRLSA